VSMVSSVGKSPSVPLSDETSSPLSGGFIICVASSVSSSPTCSSASPLTSQNKSTSERKEKVGEWREATNRPLTPMSKELTPKIHCIVMFLPDTCFIIHN
jgi:hypothetical protein